MYIFIFIPQVWLWSTSPYDCTWLLPLIPSRLYSAEYWSWICLWCQCFDVSVSTLAQALTKMKKNDKVVVVEEEDEDFLHLTWTGGAVTNRGGLNPRLDPLLGGLPQRLDTNQFEAPLQCHWTLLTWSYFNCKVTLTLVMLTWSGSERERPLI